MPLVALALTFGSFGDILEAAKIAKRMIDMLRKRGGSPERQKLISTLETICNDLSSLTTLPQDQFTTRLCNELISCRILLDQFHAKVKLYDGFLGRIWMGVSEEAELAFWRAQILERRAALRDLLGSMNIMQLHDVGEQVGRVGSQVQYLGSRVENVRNEIGTLGVVINTFFSTEISAMRSEIRHVSTDFQVIQQAIHNMSPHHNITDPYFYIRNPVGERIPILLSSYRIFNDLDRILRAYLHQRPEAGSTYVERGDYSIVSTVDGAIVPRLQLGTELRPGVEFDMSIIQRNRPYVGPSACPCCRHTNLGAVEGSWVNCSNVRCGARYQVSSIEETPCPPARIHHSRQLGEFSESVWEEDQARFFRLVQILYNEDQKEALTLEMYDKLVILCRCGCLLQCMTVGILLQTGDEIQ